jgi:hypothetical protein
MKRIKKYDTKMEQITMSELHRYAVQGSDFNIETLYLFSFRNTLHKTPQNKIYRGIRQFYPTRFGPKVVQLKLKLIGHLRGDLYSLS